MLVPLLVLVVAAPPLTAAAPTAAPPGAAAPTVTPPRSVVAGHVLVKLAGFDAKELHAADRGDRREQARVARAVRALGEQSGVALRYQRALPLGWALLRAHDLDEYATQSAVARIARLDGVKGAATDRWYRALRTPNDEYLSYQWDVDSIGLKGAWDYTQGKSTQRIGVVDSGTFLGHEELIGRDANGYDFISDSYASTDGNGRDADYEDTGDGNCGGSGEPDSFHGTHVAGTILASSDNAQGIAGINWSAQLVTVRALGQCGGSNVDIMEGLAWLGGYAIDGVPNLPATDRPSVINLSLGSGAECSQFDEDVLAYVVSQGAVPVIAAGNDGGPVNSPANCPSAVAVGAFGPTGALTSYSSFGNEIDIVGPGGDQSYSGNQEDGVLSLYSNALDPPYIFYEGTSMAAPHVAGVVSLLQAVDESLGRDDIVALFGVASGTCSGCSGKPALRADLLLAEISENVSTNPGDACVGGLCGVGQTCVSDVCRATCDGPADCSDDETCSSGGCVPDGGGGGGGGGGACDEARGNMDCASGFGCVDGVCEEGEDDGDNVGTLCDRDRDCATGLCERGVCTVTCDEDDGDCRDGFDCDEDRVPGGLCVPESCFDEDEDFCERDWACHYSSTENYVCAYGESNYGCSHQASARRAPLELALLAILVPLARRRRGASMPRA